MLSEPLAPEAALPRLASLATAAVADLCLVDLVASDGVVVRVAAAHRDAALTGTVRQLRRFPAEFGDPADPLGRVAKTGEALLLPEIRDGWLEASVGDAEYRRLLRSLGLRALVAVPLTVRGSPLGVLTLASAGPSPRYGPDQLALAEELARRVSTAVDRARWQQGVPDPGRAESEFVAAMSHEFRTPVYVISMYADLLLMGVPEPIPPVAQRHAEQIKKATDHLSELVTQVLSFSRLEAEGETVRLERVDLAALARETASLIEPLASQKRLGFGTDLPETGVEVVTDPNKLRQILFNLLGNAVKFTDAGEVRLALRVQPRRAVFEVRDTGVGISPEHREKIFEPFWQVDRESIPGSKGTGLGLGIVRRLGRLLGAEVAVESAPGAGSVFRVALPLDREESCADPDGEALTDNDRTVDGRTEEG